MWQIFFIFTWFFANPDTGWMTLFLTLVHIGYVLLKLTDTLQKTETRICYHSDSSIIFSSIVANPTQASLAVGMMLLSVSIKFPCTSMLYAKRAPSFPTYQSDDIPEAGSIIQVLLSIHFLTFSMSQSHLHKSVPGRALYSLPTLDISIEAALPKATCKVTQ